MQGVARAEGERVAGRRSADNIVCARARARARLVDRPSQLRIRLGHDDREPTATHPAISQSVLWKILSHASTPVNVALSRNAVIVIATERDRYQSVSVDGRCLQHGRCTYAR